MVPNTAFKSLENHRPNACKYCLYRGHPAKFLVIKDVTFLRFMLIYSKENSSGDSIVHLTYEGI